MSLSTILRIGASGLKVSQSGLRAVSDNISNVNTPGFVRKVVDQETAVIAGAGAGVQISGVRRAADLYLQRTSLNAAAEVGRAEAVAGFVDRAQLQFGDPSAATSFFKQLDDIFTAFSAAAEEPTSNLRRSAAVQEVGRFFEDAETISQSLRTLRQETDTRIAAAVSQANGLIEEIERLNKEIGSAYISGRDGTGAENAQSKLIDELALLIDIRVANKPYGGITLRAGDGTELVGQGPAKLVFDRSAPGGLLSITPFESATRPFSAGLEGGEIKGLVELRQTILPGMREQLGELTTRAADALNKAHNAASAVPPPAVMDGRQTGLDLPTAIAGFTGRTSISILDQTGVERRRVDVDFDAGTLTVDGAAVPGFASGTFLARMNAADVLGAFGTMAFSSGVMTLSADAPAPAPLPAGTVLGVAIVDPAIGASDRGGRGFSHYFGLNDLVRSDRYAFYETGLRAADPHGFTPGQTVNFRVMNAAGGSEGDITVTVPPAGVGTDMATLLGASAGALNDPNGMGRFGVFALDSEGALAFTPYAARPVTLEVLGDTTVRGAVPGPTLTELFGIGSDRRASRAEGFSVRADIVQTPAKLAFAQMDYAAAPGARRLAKGDGSGAFGLADAFEVGMRFERAGEVGALTMTLSSYAAEMGGVIGRRAAYAGERRDNAALVVKEADARRAGAEGVNVDEELIALTTYQQSYNASARLIQAASEMFDTLVNMI